MNATAPEHISPAMLFADCEDDPPTSELKLLQTPAAARRAVAEAEPPEEMTEPLAALASGPSSPPAPRALEAHRESAAPEREVAVGTVLGERYLLKEMIGRGGHSRVFHAEDLREGNRSVAIKMLLPEQRGNPPALTRLKREFEQMHRLSHPGIARVFGLDCDHGTWFLSMELVEGATLDARVATLGSLPESLKLVVACCEALQHAHSMGILHGDLKPSNVIVTANDGIKLIDFGSAPQLGGEFPAAEEPSLAATAGYASPQVLAGNLPEERDDIFSLACLSYVILSKGKRPFAGGEGSARLPGAPPAYIRGIPVRLFDVIVRGLAPDRELRPASVADFLDALLGADLSPCAENAPVIRNFPVVVSAPVISKRSRRRWKAIAHRKWQQLASRKHVAWGKVAAVVVAAILIATLSQMPSRTRVVASPPALPAPKITAPAPTERPANVVPTRVAAVDAKQQSQAQRPVASGIVTFESPALTVSHSQSLVAIPIRRLGSIRAPGLVAWSIDGGTARPQIDYRTEARGIARFIEGQAARSLFISLPNDRYTALKRSPRTFTVALRKVAGGSALGSVRRITVTIAPTPADERQVLQTAN